MNSKQNKVSRTPPSLDCELQRDEITSVFMNSFHKIISTYSAPATMEGARGTENKRSIVPP